MQGEVQAAPLPPPIPRASRDEGCWMGAEKGRLEQLILFTPVVPKTMESPHWTKRGLGQTSLAAFQLGCYH